MFKELLGIKPNYVPCADPAFISSSYRYSCEWVFDNTKCYNVPYTQRKTNVKYNYDTRDGSRCDEYYVACC